MDFRQRTRDEIARDLRVTTAGFARELVNTAVATLQRATLSDADPDMVRLFDEVDALVSKFRRHHRELGDARHVRRGMRLGDARKADPGVPAAARPFAYVGPYFGAYTSFDAFARGALGFAGRLHPPLDLSEVGLGLHLDRRFWTVEREGTLYAFRLDGDDAQGRDRESDRVRALLCARFGDDAVNEAMPTYAGRFPSLREFVRSSIWELRFPTWLLIHTDVAAIGYHWCVDGSIFAIAAGDGGMHVFIRRDPLSHWRYQIPV